MEMNFASRGTANTALGFGIAGTALGLMNNGGLGNLSGIFSGGNANCHENMPVNRYELGLQQELVAKDSKIALLESNIYTDGKIADVYERLNAKISCLEGQMAQQAVYNATNTATLNCISGQVAQLMSLTKCVIPITNVCPEPMAKFNSWTAPTTTTTAP